MATDGAELVRRIDDVARQADFTGVVRVDRAATTSVATYGLADRRCGVPVEAETRFGIASGTKTVTALVVLTLVEQGAFTLDMPARELLRDELPLIDDRVTVEHLLRHRSGIGDYLDESLYAEMADFELPVPAQRLSSTSAYLDVLGGHPMVSGPGERFSYNNGGFVVLALLAERAAGNSFYDLVEQLVCRPAGLVSTEFLRSDELPPLAAVGYVDDGLRTNVFHLPVRGSGDGGLYTTAADVRRLWLALLGGRIVEAGLLEQMLTPGGNDADGSLDYGLGIWLHRDGQVLEMHGYDVGASFRSVHHRVSATTCTVLSSTGDGTWPFYELLDEIVRG